MPQELLVLHEYTGITGSTWARGVTGPIGYTEITGNTGARAFTGFYWI